MVETVRVLLGVLAVYLAAGVLFAVAFHLFGLVRLDASAAASGWPFRLLITPGIVALWPILARRWRSAGVDAPHDPDPMRRLRVAHGLAWKLLAVAGPLILGGALYWRPSEQSARSLGLPSTVYPGRGESPPMGGTAP
jgi:hypothetical protein